MDKEDKKIGNFLKLSKKLNNDWETIKRFQENPLKVLAEYGITEKDIKEKEKEITALVKKAKADEPLSDIALAKLATDEAAKIWVDSHWWGYNIFLNHKAAKDLVAGLLDAAQIGIFIAKGVKNVYVALISLAIALKGDEVYIMDRGNGVYFPITWVQLFECYVTGPICLITLIHPLPR